MEDALISPEGLAILAGAGLIDATASAPLYQHAFGRMNDTVVEGGKLRIALPATDMPAIVDANGETSAYVMFVNGDEIVTEPYLATGMGAYYEKTVDNGTDPVAVSTEIVAAVDGVITAPTGDATTSYKLTDYYIEVDPSGSVMHSNKSESYVAVFGDLAKNGCTVLVDYYVKKTGGAKQLEITADSFGGNFYLEASTLIRDTNGADQAAEFVIPNCRVQSNFTFTMAATGDPSELQMRWAA